MEFLPMDFLLARTTVEPKVELAVRLTGVETKGLAVPVITLTCHHDGKEVMSRALNDAARFALAEAIARNEPLLQAVVDVYITFCPDGSDPRDPRGNSLYEAAAKYQKAVASASRAY